MLSSDVCADGDTGETSIMMKSEGYDHDVSKSVFYCLYSLSPLRVYYHIDAKAMGRHIFDKSDPKDLQLVTGMLILLRSVIISYVNIYLRQ